MELVAYAGHKLKRYVLAFLNMKYTFLLSLKSQDIRTCGRRAVLSH
jgi:hypothetical protein